MARKHAEPDGDECMAEGGVALKRGGIGMGKQTMDMPRPEHAGGGGVRRPRRAMGGAYEYNAINSPTMKEAKNEGESGFGRGGRKKRAAGGLAMGGFAAARADRPSRAKGGKVFSEAAELKKYEDGDKKSRGHEGQEVGEQPGPG